MPGCREGYVSRVNGVWIDKEWNADGRIFRRRGQRTGNNEDGKKGKKRSRKEGNRKDERGV